MFYSVLYGENRKPDGLVVKAGKGGQFKLNPKRAKATKAAQAKPTAKKDAERLMDELPHSAVADTDEAVDRLDQSAGVEEFARNLAALVEGASTRFTLPVQVDGQELAVRTERGSYRLRVTLDQ